MHTFNSQMDIVYDYRYFVHSRTSIDTAVARLNISQFQQHPLQTIIYTYMTLVVQIAKATDS